MNRQKLIIFDWDGTLADSTAAIATNMQQAFRDCRLQAPAADDIRHLIGRSLHQVIHELAPRLSDRQQAELTRAYQIRAHRPDQTAALFPEVLPCLNELQKQGYWMAVATGKSRKGLNLAIRETGTAAFWLETRCADESAAKPAPDMVWEICDRLGISISDTVIVGDTTYDLDMASNARAASIGVLTGAHKRELLSSRPHVAILNNLSELPDILTSRFAA
ncbi:MAG: HAD-IA family hydrolase [Neisseria sp.]|nr:HAD-IA family hydrolase [Neisseria sp.]